MATHAAVHEVASQLPAVPSLPAAVLIPEACLHLLLVAVDHSAAHMVAVPIAVQEAAAEWVDADNNYLKLYILYAPRHWSYAEHRASPCRGALLVWLC